MSKKIKTTLFKTEQEALASREVYFVNEGCRWYFNAQHKLFQLSAKERMYLDYMCEMMNSRNKIELNKEFRNSFIMFCNKILSVSKFTSERSLLLYEQKFRELSLIFNDYKYNGLTYVNPKYFFKGTHRERESLLKEISKYTLVSSDIMKALTDVPVDSIKPDDSVIQLPYPDDYVAYEETKNKL
jgi:hypothetical protein